MKRTILAVLVAALIGCAGDDGPARTPSGPTDAPVAAADVPPAPDTAVPDTALPDATEPPPDPGTPGDVGPPPPLAWDPDPELPPCGVDAAAPLLDEALALAGLDREHFTMTPQDRSESGYYAAGLLDDPFLLGWIRPTIAAPARAACFGQALVAPLGHGAHPVATAIRHASRQAERWLEGAPLEPKPDLRAALMAACAAAGHTYDPGPLDLPPAVDAALAPILWAVVDGVVAREALAASTQVMSAHAWTANGGVAMETFGMTSLLTNPKALAYLLSTELRPALNLAAARIAFAIEATDWSPITGLTGVSLDLDTPLGAVRIRDAADHTHPDTGAPVLLSLDLGGNDTYLGPAGAVTHGNGPVSLCIDLGGDDTYGYEPIATPHDTDWLLPADAAGRFAGDGSYGPITLSRVGRQGSGRNGIGMLFDLGEGRDRYTSLAMSQGYAHLGVGVLFDAGGDDVYRSETSSQGAATSGIGLLMDAGGGNDRYESIHASQGSAASAGVGILWDQGGDDVYRADPGDQDGHAIYYSPQMPGIANNSMSQGASRGVRFDAAGTFLSGGLGILRDERGDDTYLAGLFAQGAGYWQALGLLSDGDGADGYDAFWYVQGGAAHYAIGMLLDGGDGPDRFNLLLPTRSVQLGSGHDYSLGVFVNERGDDTYRFASLAMGASNCNGIGLAVDNGGNDTYETPTDTNSGLGNASDECVGNRPNAVSIGLMIDAGGTDTYTYPDSPFPIPTDNGTWGHVTHDIPSEHGAGLDREGETGVHAP